MKGEHAALPTPRRQPWSWTDGCGLLDALAHRAGLIRPGHCTTTEGLHGGVLDDIHVSMQAQALGFEARPIRATDGEIAAELLCTSPAIFKLRSGGFAGMLSGGQHRVVLLAPDGALHRVPHHRLLSELRAAPDNQAGQAYEAVLTKAGISAGRRTAVLQILLDDGSNLQARAQGWHLEPSLGTGFLGFLQQSGIKRNGGFVLAAHVAEYLLWMASWAVLGRLSFEGHMDRGWLWLWALLLLTIVPFRLMTAWAQGLLAIGSGLVLKRRLLWGALRLRPEEIRHQGVGSFIGQIFESAAVESLASNGAVASILALVELIGAGFLLGRISMLLVLWIGLLALFGTLFLRHYQRWTGTRMEMTQDLVEKMLGHRTRLAQQPPGQWHASEDAVLTEYLTQSQKSDARGARLVVLIPRGWLLAGLVCLIPAATTFGYSSTDLAVKLGGVLLAYAAFKKLTQSSVNIAATVTAASRILPLFRSAQRSQPSGSLAAGCRETKSEVLIDADGISFGYRDGGKMALNLSSLTVFRGDRILVEGGSGGGKSTLASLLSGMREPGSGLLLLNGLDRHLLGEDRWRQLVASAPQFHENHILTETLAFNLLMGRAWPPSGHDLYEAEDLCRRLGLGDLLDRMPGGIMQMVGESGWQLSHGERSRVFVARALLQRADLVILDESFAALDGENVERAIRCCFDEAETLMVIAHP